MSISELKQPDIELIQDEENRYQKVLTHIREAFRNKTEELAEDEKRAREMTATIVATKQEEEKQFLQSDESVAHGLAHLRFRQTDALSDLVKQPYFARVQYQEKNRTTEFKLGVASFPEERIIDWRKAPISKLYYDYEEGDEYDDEIAGVERQGKVVLKRAYRGLRENLTQIETRENSYVKSSRGWTKMKRQSQAVFSMSDKEKLREFLKSEDRLNLDSAREGDGYLSQILALLSPDQFRLISSEQTHPVVVQGSAGTGKTTVALHRLAWLLFEGNSKAREDNSLVIVLSPTLARYVKNVLPALGIHGVKIATYAEWALDVIRTRIQPKFHYRDGDVAEELQTLKSDPAFFERFKKFSDNSSGNNFLSLLWDFYASTAATDLACSAEVVAAIRDQSQKKFIDASDLSLLVEMVFLRDDDYGTQHFPSEFGHLVIDEAQDFNFLEIKTLVNGLKDRTALTIAGDLGQKILKARGFEDWNGLLSRLGYRDTQPLTLSLAYRSTYQIYELAESVRDPLIRDEDLKMFPRFGPDPKLTICHHQTEAIDLTRAWIEGIMNVNQKVVAAVICPTSAEARHVFGVLSRQGLPGIRIGNAQHFDFTPGVTITDIKNAKGLEFQAVLLFDVSEKQYPENALAARNALYVGMTRAVVRLDLIAVAKASTLIPEFINTEDLTAIPDEDDDPTRMLFDLTPEEIARRGKKIDDEENEEAEERDMLDEIISGEENDDDMTENDLEGLSEIDEEDV